MKILFTNARIIDPETKTDRIGELGVYASQLVAPTVLADDPETQRINLHGLALAPGLIDLHVHLREPGQKYKEDIASGTAAAAAGGFTTIVAMPNTIPAIDSPAQIKDLNDRIHRDAAVQVLVSACLSRGRDGTELTDLAELATTARVVAFTDDGGCLADAKLMQRATEIAAANDMLIMDHCEDRTVWNQGVVREGAIAGLLGVPGMPPATESNMVQRNIELSRKTGAHIHLQHLSCRRSIELLSRARAAGLPVSGEATPHHLALTNDEVPLLGNNAKMNPPLGTADDREALQAAVADGTIQAIATDHAPHAAKEKAGDLLHAPFGIIGLETALPIALTTLVHSGRMQLVDLIARLTRGPAEILQLPLGTLQPGSEANLVVFDPDCELTLDLRRSRSKSRNSPFHGRTVKGRIQGTMYRGNWIYTDDLEVQPD